jgi:DNA-binding Lrp family transcriptional regulator
MEPTLAVIDIDIISGQDELAREGLLMNLKQHRDPCLTVLWVNWLRERADLRVVCLIHDLARLDDFLVDVIRSVPGVRGTSAQLAFDGVIRADALMDVSMLAAGWDKRAAATVMVKLQPGHDRDAYDSLVALPPHKEVAVVWVVKLFHRTDADLMIMLLGERTAALTAYVMSWMRTIPGVMDTQLTSVLDWYIHGETEEFIALTKRFPEPEPAPVNGQ